MLWFPWSICWMDNVWVLCSILLASMVSCLLLSLPFKQMSPWPCLFTLAMEYFSRRLRWLHKNSDFNYHPRCERQLVFADDLLIFAREINCLLNSHGVLLSFLWNLWIGCQLTEIRFFFFLMVSSLRKSLRLFQQLGRKRNNYLHGIWVSTLLIKY